MLTIVVCVALTVYAGKIIKEQWGLHLKGYEYTLFILAGLTWGVSSANYLASYFPQERILLATGTLNPLRTDQSGEVLGYRAECPNGIWYYLAFKSTKERYGVLVSDFTVVNDAASVREREGFERLENIADGFEWSRIHIRAEAESDKPGILQVSKNFFDLKRSRGWWYLIAIPAPIEEIELIVTKAERMKEVSCRVLQKEEHVSLTRNE